MRRLAWSCALAAVVAASGCRDTDSHDPGTPLSPSERDHIERQVRSYFEKVVDLPPDVRLRLVGLAPTAAPGLVTAELEIANDVSHRQVPLVLTRDGRFLVQGTLADLTGDPYEAVMRQIRVEDRPTRGGAGAPVTVVTYLDFQCPFSARVYRTLVEGLLPKYGDRLRLVFKSFPLDTVHPWATAAAAAAACAGDQEPDLYFSIAEELFRDQDEVTSENLGSRVAARLTRENADAKTFAVCADSGAGLAKVRADEEEGRRLGVRSTPTVFVNGRKLEGARPLEDLEAAVELAMGAAEAPSTTRSATR